MNNVNTLVKMTYTPQTYEFKIQHTQGAIFTFDEYYPDGNFMGLLGFPPVNEGSSFYTNTLTPKLFSQQLIYITIPELAQYNTFKFPFTFLLISQPGFEIISNINNTFANEIKVHDQMLDELTIQIRSSDGLPFVNNKGEANFIMILSY